jgi:hypothetical protein
MCLYEHLKVAVREEMHVGAPKTCRVSSVARIPSILVRISRGTEGDAGSNPAPGAMQNNEAFMLRLQLPSHILSTKPTLTTGGQMILTLEIQQEIRRLMEEYAQNPSNSNKSAHSMFALFEDEEVYKEDSD